MKKLAWLAMMSVIGVGGQTLRLHPVNGHYYEFRGKTTVLATSAEHYGAVLNLAFDQKKYLDTLAKDGLNLTRIFSGAYREFPGDFNIMGNTLAPEPEKYITPWEKTAGGKWDLTKWNSAYFARLKDFVREADRRGIVVEMTLFTTYYSKRNWEASPLFVRNNVNGVGECDFESALTLKHAALVKAEEEMVRKFVRELNEFDNVLFEICNEPYFGGVTLEWQRRIAEVIAETEQGLPKRHLIAQNIANNQQVITEPNPLVSVFNFHYARPPVTVEQNYGLNKVIGYDESGFDGQADFVYRIQGWDFIHAGGAHYNNLDYSFSAGHEDGKYPVAWTQPGGGSVALRKQLGTLLEYLAGFDLTKMAPMRGVITGGVPENAAARVLGEEGRQYAVYLHFGRQMSGYSPNYVVSSEPKLVQLEMKLPKGAYQVEWVQPREGMGKKSAVQVTSDGGAVRLSSPSFREDIAIRLIAK